MNLFGGGSVIIWLPRIVSFRVYYNFVNNYFFLSTMTISDRIPSFVSIPVPAHLLPINMHRPK